MAKSDVVVAAAVGAVSGVVALVVFAVVVTGVNEHLKKRPAKAKAKPVLSVVPVS